MNFVSARFPAWLGRVFPFRPNAWLCLPVCTVLSACAPFPWAASSLPWAKEAIPGELVVAFRSESSAALRETLLNQVGAKALGLLQGDEGQTWVRVSLPEGQEKAIQTQLEAMPQVALVEANLRRRVASVGPIRPVAGPLFTLMPGLAPRSLMALTNDPYLQAPGPLPGQAACWALHAVQAPAAWDRSAGEGISVAIIDTGVDLQHPDLAANLDTTNAINLVEPGRPAQDDFGHGTHVAGIVAAVGNNGLGALGLAFRARLLPIRVLGVDGTGSSFDSARAIRHAVSKGCKVLNLSLGALAPSEAEAQAVAAAISAGAVVVAAAGNEAVDGNPIEYPAGYPGVISVGASGPDGQRAPFSNFGQVTLSAPGVDVFSTLPVALAQGAGANAQAYGYLSGTSMAAPMVAAGAALVFASHPGWTGAQVVAHLRKSARELSPPGDVGGPDQFTGSGQLDAAEAVQ